LPWRAVGREPGRGICAARPATAVYPVRMMRLGLLARHSIHNTAVPAVCVAFSALPFVAAGALLGGGQGAAVALRSRPEWTGGPDTSRLRLNRLLNQSGKTGRAAGNALGVLGLFFASFESGFGYLNDARLPDWSNTVGAGAQLMSTSQLLQSLVKQPQLRCPSSVLSSACAARSSSLAIPMNVRLPIWGSEVRA